MKTAAAACLMVALAFGAAAFELDGLAVQGGLLVGRAAPGAQVEVDGRPVRVSTEGLFLVGFGRDAGPTSEVRVGYADGRRVVRTIEVGQRDYPVQRIDGLPARQVTPGPAELERIRADGARISAARAGDSATPHFAGGFVRPADGPTSGVFGSRRILNGIARRPHFGHDIAAPAGAPGRAAGAGMVVLAQARMFYTGGTVMIDHGHGLVSVYAHMSAIEVAVGALVAKGQTIGRVGATGRVTGPHLHWGVTLRSVQLDPERLVD